MTDRAEDPLIEEALRWFVVLRDVARRERSPRLRTLAHDRRRPRSGLAARARGVGTGRRARSPSMADRTAPSSHAVPDIARRPRSLGRRRWLQAAAVAAIAAPAAYLVSRPELWADHRTAAGERRTVGLADGSTVELAGGSALSVSFDKDAPAQAGRWRGLLHRGGRCGTSVHRRGRRRAHPCPRHRLRRQAERRRGDRHGDGAQGRGLDRPRPQGRARAGQQVRYVARDLQAPHRPTCASPTPGGATASSSRTPRWARSSPTSNAAAAAASC